MHFRAKSVLTSEHLTHIHVFPVEGVRWRVWLPLLSPVLFVLLFTTTADAFV